MTASKLLRPLMAHRALPPSWKLTVYRAIIQSILLYAMESSQLTPPQLTKLNHVHFQSLRRIFGVKSFFYHRVLNPTNEDCSNSYLASLSFHSSRVIAPSRIYSLCLDTYFRILWSSLLLYAFGPIPLHTGPQQSRTTSPPLG